MVLATFDKAALILPLVELIRRSGDPIDDLPAWPPHRAPPAGAEGPPRVSRSASKLFKNEKLGGEGGSLGFP